MRLCKNGDFMKFNKKGNIKSILKWNKQIRLSRKDIMNCY